MVRNEAFFLLHLAKPSEGGRQPSRSLRLCACLVSQPGHCKGPLFMIKKKKRSVLSSTFRTRKLIFNQTENKGDRSDATEAY